MKPFPVDLWSTIQSSLICAAEGRRLIEQAGRIRAESKLLRQDSAELIRSTQNQKQTLPDTSKVTVTASAGSTGESS